MDIGHNQYSSVLRCKSQPADLTKGEPHKLDPLIADAPTQDNVTFNDQDEVKVWLVHGSHTGGHASAARSLKQALEKDPNVTAEIVNMADTSSAETPASTAAEVALNGGEWRKTIRRWVFDRQYKGNNVIKWLSNQVMKREGQNQEAFLTKLETEKPDILVSTMSASNSLLSSWADQGKVEQPIQSVVTDFASHQMWAQNNIAKYFVATPEVESDLEKFGVDADDIEVTGIPIKEEFSMPARSSGEARASLGLNPDNPLVLMLGGSLGYGSFNESLSAMDKQDGEFQMAAITGRNKELKSSLEELDLGKDLHVEGYVTNMPSWLEAADIVVTKPGGLTCSEILALGKPMILQAADSGLEARMVDRLEEMGAAIVVDGTEDLAATVSKLMSNPEKLDKMKSRAREVGKPNASQNIADQILATARRHNRPVWLQPVNQSSEFTH